MEIFNRQETKKKRKVLRKKSNRSRKLLWSKLRNRQVEGYKFLGNMVLINI